MKKNAILIGAILFLAGCAHQGGYGTAGTETGSSASTEVSTSSISNNTELHTRSAEGGIETPSMKAARDVSADSSVRGGSLDARDHNLNTPPAEPGGSSDSNFDADSSVRGGTLKARGVEPYHSSLNDATSETSNDSSSTTVSIGEGQDAAIEGRGDFGQGSSATWQSDKAHGSVAGSANWNASDDLLPDGSPDANSSVPSRDHDEMNNDASIGGAATHESGSGSSTSGSDSASGDLNSSSKLESNISGDFDLDDSTERSSSLETESPVRSSDAPEPQVGVINNEPEWLFENNRAQGVGSAATGEFGVSHSRNPLSSETPVQPKTDQHDLQR